MSMFLRLETASMLLGSSSKDKVVTYVPLSLVQKVESTDRGGSIVSFADASGANARLVSEMSPDLLLAECLVNLGSS